MIGSSGKTEELKLCDRRIQSGLCRGIRLKCDLNYRYQRCAHSKRNTLRYRDVQLYTHVIKCYRSFGIGRSNAGRCRKKLYLRNALLRM
jgi:hypothetical protein